ncbi:MAG TPA: FlgD immunoglobulin-like domain containing protein [Ardenticatenaceae bacterium]|nr:FlgD immunoglobulin-like domain containing protein [Ardenticatenaceae bacterium]
MSEVYSRSRAYRSRSRRGARSALQLPSALSLAAAAGVIALVIIMFPLDWLRAPRVSLATDQTVFSPNGDGALDQISVFYTLSEQATVTARVVNAAGQTVRTLVREQPQTPGQHGASWDGRDEGGSIAPDGNYRIVVVAAGSARRAEQSTPVTVDTTPPPLVLANLPPSHTTASATLQIEGSTAPDATVWLNDEVAPIPVDANGVFRVSRQLVEGQNHVVVRAADSAGNESRAESEISLLTQPPAITLLAPEAGTWFGENVVNVAGTVPPGVSVTVNDRPATVDEEGNFRLDVVLLEGDNVIRVVATDAVGNSATEERVVHLRSRGPTITLANVPDGLVVRDPSLRVAGQVDPGSRLQINGNVVPVDNQGTFNTVLALQGGNNLLSFAATDRAGNTTTVQRSVIYETAPAGAAAGPLAAVTSGSGAPRILIGIGVPLLFLIVLAVWRRPVHLSLSVDRPNLTPNQPGQHRTLTMRLDLSRAARVSLDVYDQMDQHVTTLVEDRRHSGGEHFRLWDGRDRTGQILPAGNYQIEATARTLAGSVTSAVWVQLDPTPALLGSRSTQRERWRRPYVPEDEVIDIS